MAKKKPQSFSMAREIRALLKANRSGVSRCATFGSFPESSGDNLLKPPAAWDVACAAAATVLLPTLLLSSIEGVMRTE